MNDSRHHLIGEILAIDAECSDTADGIKRCSRTRVGDSIVTSTAVEIVVCEFDHDERRCISGINWSGDGKMDEDG